MTTPDTISRLHDDQRQAWADTDAAVRAQYPDCQWDSTLPMPRAPFDPTPAEQQQWADSYRAEHLDADMRIFRHPGDKHPSTRLADALYEWRNQTANRRWEHQADSMLAGPPCAVDGADSQRTTVTVAGRSLYICTTCRPYLDAALAARQAAARQPVGDGRRTRAQAAADVVDGLLT